MDKKIVIKTTPENDRRTVAEREYQIKNIWNHHQEMIRRAAVGQKPKDIAAALGVTTATVGNVIYSELGKKAIAALQAEMNTRVVDVGRRIREIAPDAIDLIDKVVNYHKLNPEEKVALNGEIPDIKTRISTSLDILDRAGHGAVKKVAGVIAHGVMTKSDIEEIKRRGRMSLNRAEEIEEATIEVVNNNSDSGGNENER